MTLGFDICPSFKDHSLSRRAKPQTLRFATFSPLHPVVVSQLSCLTKAGSIPRGWGVPGGTFARQPSEPRHEPGVEVSAPLCCHAGAPRSPILARFTPSSLRC